MRPAICLGSAACMQADLDAAAAMGIVPGDRWLLIAVNHAARDYPGHVDHWATFHADLMPGWIKARLITGRPPAGALWTGNHRAQPQGLRMQKTVNWGGSSGLLAVSVALTLSCDPIVLCGIPLDHEQGHFDSAKKWRDAVNYRKGWIDHKIEMANTRSMSGWTQGLLGAPTQEWLDSMGLGVQAAPATAESA